MKVFDDITVLDLSRYLPGGYATQVLADYGADVIKVEDTGMGDFCRHEQPCNKGMSYYFSALGRNKRSVSFNLKDKEVLQAFYQLVKSADVVIESFRPGATNKLGIDYETLHDLNPQLVYCSLSGYGHDDPRSLKPLHDINMQAQSGYLSLNGGVKAPLHLCDLATAMVAAQSILIALHERQRSGIGRYIDISMFDSFVWWNSMIDSRWSFQGEEITEKTIAYPDDCPFYNIYDTKDGGKLSVGLIEEKFWNAFCDLTQHPEIKDRTQPGTYETMKEIIASKTLAEWDQWLQDKDLCMAPVVDKTTAIHNILEREPQTMGYIDSPQTGSTLQTNLPHAIEGIRPEISNFRPAPALGQDTEAVLQELGYTDEHIKQLIESGAVKSTSPEAV